MSSTKLSGIDVSYYQGDVDWQAVKAAGVTFAFARATYGSSKVDPKFSTYWPAIKAAGMVRGTYHFYVSSDDPTAQANFFVSTVGSLGLDDLPPVLDVEAGSGTTNLVSGVQTWLDIVEQKLERTPMIYTGPSFWNEYMTGGFGSYPLWVAEYGVSAPKQTNGWSTWAFWQYSESGSVAGISPVDLDYFNGSADDLRAFIQTSAGKEAIASPPQPPEPAQPPATATQTYTVQSGDTLAAIANRYDTTVEAICQANDIETPNLIEVGQVLIIPS
jgi:lysozyme